MGLCFGFALAALIGRHWLATASSETKGAAAGRPPAEAASSASVLWVGSGDRLESHLQANVSCSSAARLTKGACEAPRRGGRCARLVVDDAVPAEAVRELQKMLQWLVDEAWGAGSGPPSVVDLHQGSISYKDKFVDLHALMDFKSLNFTDAQVEAYNEVRRSIRGLLARFFGVPEANLLHDLTFFSHINASKVAKTVHDEYWHSHIDTLQYGTFAYTALLYLSTEQEDFEGGSFLFEDQPLPRRVAPRLGRLVAFTSDAENPHRVEPVTKGVRSTLTAAFTCDVEKARSIEDFPKKASVNAGSEDARGSTQAAG